MSQTQDYLRDFRLVALGEKPVVIIERRKSPEAYLKVLTALCRDRYQHLNSVHRPLADSSGKRDIALIVGRSETEVYHVLDLLRHRDKYTREGFQILMGEALGYSMKDCMEFVSSPLSRTCGCECCGGPTPESKLDDEARVRRNMYINT